MEHPPLGHGSTVVTPGEGGRESYGHDTMLTDQRSQNEPQTVTLSKLISHVSNCNALQ